MKTINQIGLEHGVHPVQVGQWQKILQEQAKTLFEGKRGPKPVAAHREPELLYTVWSTDITYIRLPRGFAYLVAVIDWYSRKVLNVKEAPRKANEGLTGAGHDDELA